MLRRRPASVWRKGGSGGGVGGGVWGGGVGHAVVRRIFDGLSLEAEASV